MRNIFLFIRRFSNFLLFLVLQIIAITFLVRYNKSHEAAFMGVAGEVTGKINQRYTNVNNYFGLKETNDALVKENIHLRNLLKENYQSPDTTQRFVIDSIRVDSLLRIQKFKYYDAPVAGNFISAQNNYITIHRGANQGVKKDWGVISAQGIVGRVVNVGPNFSVVMSALHRQFSVNAMLKKGGERGSVYWDGESPLFLYLKDIPKSAQVQKGDTVLTSTVSDIYPPGIMVGTIAEIINEKSSNFYKLKLKTATAFSNIQYVTVIEDLQKEERSQVEKEVKKN